MDGEALELPDDIEGILILNIPSYMGGVNLWASGAARGGPGGGAEGAPQSFCDGMLEVRLVWLLLMDIQGHPSHPRQG